MFMIILLIFAVIFSLAHLFFKKKPLMANDILSVFSFYSLIILIGGCGILGFIGHAFYANEASKAIGWAAGSPFQFQVGAAYLTLGLLGILCIFFKKDFWLATACAQLIFFLTCSLGSFSAMLARYAEVKDKIELFLYFTDIIIPILVFSLVITTRLLQKRKIK